VGKWHCGKFPKEEFDFARSYSGVHWIKRPNGKGVHVTRQNESDALEFLRTRPADNPFFLTVAFFATHAEDGNPKQYLPQPPSMELYRDAVIPIPRTATDEHFRRLPPFIANDKNESRNRWRWRFDTPEKYQEMLTNYYRLATEVDAACGSVIAELKRQDLWNNTLVVFTTDNGYFHGEHGLADKWYPYEESIRVPLIVRDPRMAAERRGQTNDELTLNVDLAPAILAAAGLQVPSGMQGRDLSPLYLKQDPPRWREDFFYEHATIRSKEFIPASQALVSEDWKYILWPEFDYEQMFDLRTDRAEEHDLARDPRHAEQLARLRARFKEVRTVAATEPTKGRLN
jgi:arylsulfatase